MKKNNFFKTISLSSVLFISGCTVKSCNNNDIVNGVDCESLEKGNKVELTYWRLFEDSSVMNEIIKGFEEKYPRIKINIVKKDYNSYYDNLKESLGTTSGRPDIVQLRNDWFVDFQNSLYSADSSDWKSDVAEDALTYIKSEAICRNDENWDSIKLGSIIEPLEVDKNFAPIVYEDTIIDGKVYGTALYVETLGIFYNKDIFSSAIPRIDNPPETWEEFADIAARLTVDVNGKHPGENGFQPRGLVISGAAFGDSQLGINRATDILSAMFMQYGIQMTDQNVKFATFDQSVRGKTAQTVLDFYTSFTDPRSDNTSWEGNFMGGIGADEAFRQGKVAMIINYPHKLRFGPGNYWEAVNSRDPVTGKQPRFELGVAELPIFAQDSIDLTYGSYFGEAVSSVDHPYESWLFLRYLSGLDDEFRQDTPVWKYASATNLPASRTGQDFLTNQINFPHDDYIDWRDLDTLEPLIKPFVMQISQAKSWQKKDPISTEGILSSMIISVQKLHDPQLKSSDAVASASSDVAVSAAVACINRVFSGTKCELKDILKSN